MALVVTLLETADTNKGIVLLSAIKAAVRKLISFGDLFSARTANFMNALKELWKEVVEVFIVDYVLHDCLEVITVEKGTLAGCNVLEGHNQMVVDHGIRVYHLQAFKSSCVVHFFVVSKF